MVDFLDELESLVDEDEENEGLSLSSLREEIKALSKEKHGLLKGVQEERAKRQEISGRLNQLTSTVNQILTQRQQDSSALSSVTGSADDKLPVTWTEDGEGFIDKSQINQLLTPYQEKINQLENLLQNSNNVSQAEREAQKVKESIIGEDERYEPAYKKYQAARKWVTEQVADFARIHNVNRPLTSGEALDYVFNREAETEFKEMFPELSLDDIVVAEDSQRMFRRTLGNVAATLSPNSSKSLNARQDSRFQRVLNKPSGLGSHANAKGGQLSIIDKMGTLSPMDLMNLSDDQVAAIERAIRNEEQSDGVNF